MPRPTLFPTLRYRDAHAALDWLVRTLGFAKRDVHLAPDGSVAHAELGFGPCSIGLNTATPPTPDNPWSDVAQGLYVCAADVDALHDRARAACAKIVSPLKDQPYGSREFGAYDAEGFLWGFGTYDMAVADGEPTLYPELRYDNCERAMDLLVRAFGFTKALVIPAPGGSVLHAEMRFGDDVLMVGSRLEDPGFRDLRQHVNLRVSDPDAHHARAAAAGAEIIQPLTDTPYGARSYAVRDPEGFVWAMSTYKPEPRAAVA
jgi:uncharacterized glyoxalase superfamily protein PhnB